MLWIEQLEKTCFTVEIQFEASDATPCTARNLHHICHVATTYTKQFHVLLKAMHAVEIWIHIKSKQVIFLVEFQKTDVNVNTHNSDVLQKAER